MTKAYLLKPARENLRLVNKLLKVRGVKYEEQDEQGNTALHLAALGANVELIKSLMRNKEQILEVNREGQTPLHLAAGTGAVRAMRTILNSPEGKKTLESEDSRHQTPLLIAASVGSKEVINLMLSHGASVRKRNSDKETPLHICARFDLYGHSSFIYCISTPGMVTMRSSLSSSLKSLTLMMFTRRQSNLTLLGAGLDLSWNRKSSEKFTSRKDQFLR